MANEHYKDTPESGDSVSDFGYKQVLHRGTHAYASFSVAFAFVSIATGIFTTYGSVLQSSGPAGIWTWPLAVLGQLMVALVFGSLAARMPITGYSYQWTSRLANPVIGWMIGWISFTFLSVVVVAVDYTIASAVLPVLLNYHGSPMNAWMITGLTLLIQALIVGFSTRWTERINNTAVSLELIGMVLLVVLLAVVGAIRHAFIPANLFSTGSIPFNSNYFSFGSLTHVGPWMLGTLLGSFTIVGFESAANLAEETHNPARVIPRSMAMAVVISGALGFLFLIAVTLLARDPETLALSSTPVADVINDTLGSLVGNSLLILVVVAIFACGMVILMSAVRLVWAMSRDARFPGYQFFSKVSNRTGTPLAATWLQWIISEVILALFALKTDALFSLFSAATLLPTVIYTATLLLYITKRHKLPPSRGFSLGKYEIPVLWLSSIWLIFELLIFRDSSFAASWLYVLVMLLIGGCYLLSLIIRKGISHMEMPAHEQLDTTNGRT